MSFKIIYMYIYWLIHGCQSEVRKHVSHGILEDICFELELEVAGGISCLLLTSWYFIPLEMQLQIQADISSWHELQPFHFKDAEPLHLQPSHLLVPFHQLFTQLKWSATYKAFVEQNEVC